MEASDVAFLAPGLTEGAEGPVPASADRRLAYRFVKRAFDMCKFRSTHADADERLAELVGMNEADDPLFKIKNDPRVTRIGRFVDELPQAEIAFSTSLWIMQIPLVKLFAHSTQIRRMHAKRKIRIHLLGLSSPSSANLWQLSRRVLQRMVN